MSLRGYSSGLDLHLRWEGGELVSYDPATVRPISTLQSEGNRADTKQACVRDLGEPLR